MGSENCSNDDYSDDDIFLSPGKKRKVLVDHSSNSITHVKGIYEERVRRLKSCLVGIPHPPMEPRSIDFTMEDIKKFIQSDKSTGKGADNESNIKESVEKCKFGIYLNLDHSCEELERLGALYVEKYLPFETMSTLSDYQAYTNLTASAKKRRRCNGWATSPGSRLSYLARRKTTFSVEQVSKMGLPVNSKKLFLQSDQNMKSFTISSKPKRALFQSPDEDKKRSPNKTPEFGRRRRIMPRVTNSNPVPPRSSKENGIKRSCRKSLEFVSNSEKSMCNAINEPSDKHLKRKLLWAVSTALKGVSVTSSHSKFKICMNKLFKASLKVWCDTYQGKKSQRENTVSTSETMLSVANSLLNQVIIPELSHTDDSNEPDSVSSIDDGTNENFDGTELNESGCIMEHKPTAGINNLVKEVLQETNVPSGTLSELTNSNKSLIFKRQSNITEFKNNITIASSLGVSPRKAAKNNLGLFKNLEEEFRCSNHKRKRAD